MERLTDTCGTRAEMYGLTGSAGPPARHGRTDLSMGRTPLMNNSPQADYEWNSRVNWQTGRQLYENVSYKR